jgi:predicted SAM-dependent methyltransferase
MLSETIRKGTPKLDLKLHLGCGLNVLDGWVNIDQNTLKDRYVKLGRKEAVERDIDLQHDLRRRLPYEDCSATYIYNEHLIEHVSFDDGTRMMRDWLRVLKPGGVLRMATPSIEDALTLYNDPKRFDRLNVGMRRKVPTRAVFMNQLFRSFGHLFIYDEPTIRRQLGDIGYVGIVSLPVSESPHDALRGLETRICGRNSFLTSMCIEATKPG